MTIRLADLSPVDFEPDYSGRSWASRQLARARSGWPAGPLYLPFPGLGELRLALSGLAPIEHQSTAGIGACESYALWRAGRYGRLDLDARFGAALAASLLGTAPTLALHRPLSPGERGAVGAFVSLVLDRTAAPLAVALDPPDAVPLRLDVQVELDLSLFPEPRTIEDADAVPVKGWARLFLPWAWFEPNTTHWSHLARVPFPVVLEIARTQLDRQQFAGFQIGDALVFDGYAAAPAQGPKLGRLVLGAFAAQAHLNGTEIRLQGAFEPLTGNVLPETTMPIAVPLPAWKGNSSMSTTIEMASVPVGNTEMAASSSLTQALVNTPVEVVAEVGRLVLTGAELAGLEQGEVFSLGTASKGTVTLSVGGRPVARGVLVNIDGTFGVRVTERY